MYSATGSKRVWLAAGVGLVVVLGLFVAPDWLRRPAGVIGRPAVVAFSFLQASLASMVSSVGGVWSGYIDLVAVREAQRALEAELAERTRERDALLEIREENRRLSGLLDVHDPVAPMRRAARVIGRDPSRWYESITIDRGSRDGALVDRGVELPAGIVGTVIKVFPSTAVVLLITDRQSAIPVVVQRTREQGIVEGAVGGRVRLKYLPPSSDIREGDVILTSGLTEPFPKGLLVGRVIGVDRPEGALYPEVELAPAADLSRLEEVLVFDPEPGA